jgi:hypothetical protein
VKIISDVSGERILTIEVTEQEAVAIAWSIGTQSVKTSLAVLGIDTGPIYHTLADAVKPSMLSCAETVELNRISEEYGW